jgi:Zn-finger nucleic acid-binding protein
VSDSESLQGHCPACADHPELEELSDREVPFLGCTKCFGLFVKEDALGQYVCNAADSEQVGKSYDDLLLKAMGEQGGQGKRGCPECSSPMRRFGFGEAPFMILDRCEHQHGLWLDKKELKKVVRASRAHAIVLGWAPPPGAEDEDDEE